MAVEKKATFKQLTEEAIQNGMSEAAFKQRVDELLDADDNLSKVEAAAKVVRESMRSQKDHATLVELILKHGLTVADLKRMLELADKEGWFGDKEAIARINTKAFRTAFGQDSVVRRRENLYFDRAKNPTKAFFRQGQARWPTWLQALFLKKLVNAKPSRTADKWEALLQMPPKQLSEKDPIAKKAIDEVAAEFFFSTSDMTEAQVESLLSAGRE